MKIINLGKKEELRVPEGTEACVNCRYFIMDPSSENSQGLCRLKPPIVFPIPGQLGGVNIMGASPPVKTSDWCGEFVAKLNTSIDSAN